MLTTSMQRLVKAIPKRVSNTDTLAYHDEFNSPLDDKSVVDLLAEGVLWLASVPLYEEDTKNKNAALVRRARSCHR